MKTSNQNYQIILTSSLQNWTRWEEEKPKWLDDKMMSAIPMDLIPTLESKNKERYRRISEKNTHGGEGSRVLPILAQARGTLVLLDEGDSFRNTKKRIRENEIHQEQVMKESLRREKRKLSAKREAQETEEGI